MRKILIEGLEDEGPGDIVGAISHQAEISGELIGNIEIKDGYATVEIDANVVDLVVEKMDDNRVGHSEVTVRRIEDGEAEEHDHASSYVDRYDHLIELEREEEMRQHEAEIRDLSGPEREAKGRALVTMRGWDEGESIEGHRITFMKTREGEELPDTEIAVGDLVMISKEDPLRDDNPTGTVTEMTGHSITVVFDEQPDGFLTGKGLRVDLYVNDITYQRMKTALEELEEAEGRLLELRSVITGDKDPAEPAKSDIDTWYNEELNDPQREAVRRSMGADEVYLIHGPPGTGKTTTVVEVIRQVIAADKSVLVTAASNTAVDTILEFLLEQDVDAVRVGHPARVTQGLREHTLDALLEESETYQQSREIREQAFDVLDEQDELTAPPGRYRRGMSDEHIRRLAERGEGSRGVPAEKIEEMAEWLDFQDEADELFEESDRLEKKAIAEIIEEADVVCTTNSTAGSELLEDRHFDTLVLDEATQATEPSCLIPITKADEVVMAGDHRQLPPTVKSQEAEDKGLGGTLFERLIEDHGDRIADMLTVQYRMHEDIMDFSSGQFYDGRLEADATVRDHTLADLDIDTTAFSDRMTEVLDPAALVVFLDTSGLEAEERSREGSTSKDNELEAELITEMVEDLLAAGMEPADIAVIAPYTDQVECIRDMVDEETVEVDTVDGFQGREKEAVLISLTRSNDASRVGFLRDVRRLNVALTRARRKLVVVGDSTTIGSEPIYGTFLEYVDERGRYLDAAADKE